MSQKNSKNAQLLNVLPENFVNIPSFKNLNPQLQKRLEGAHFWLITSKYP